jgi:hypothetical protein
MIFLTQQRLRESFQNHSTYEITKYLWLPLTLDGKKKWLERATIAYIVDKNSKKEKYYLKPILFLKQTTKTQITMFNSRKIKKLNQQQDLLDAKINSLAHGQKSLSEDFDVQFKRMRQTYYTSEERINKELSSEVKTEMAVIRRQYEFIQKRMNEIISVQKNEIIVLSTKMQLLIDQIGELNNQISIPKSELPLGTPIEVTPIGVGRIGVPTWTMRSGSAEYQSSPIQDKMKLEVEEVFADPIYPTESVNTKKRRKERKAVDDREDFFINVKLPEGVTNYLHNRSASKSMSVTCRNVFERGGKLVFAPLSYEITKNFFGSKNKITTIQVSKNTYLAIRQIAEELVMTMTQVASNFVATMDSTEATEIGLKYSAFNSKELQTKTSAPRRGVGRPKIKK